MSIKLAAKGGVKTKMNDQSWEGEESKEPYLSLGFGKPTVILLRVTAYENFPTMKICLAF